MQSFKDAEYRLRIAEGFLKEAKQHIELGFYRSVVDNAQLVVENSIKAVISIFKAVPKVHELDKAIEDLMKEHNFSIEVGNNFKKLKACAELLDFETHIRTDYGDETKYLTPWELFDEADAKEALSTAKEAFGIAIDLINCFKTFKNDYAERD